MEKLQKEKWTFSKYFSVTDQLKKEHPIQGTLAKAALLHTVIAALTFFVHREVRDDLPLRIYFSKGETKKRVGIAALLWLALWF